MSITLAAGQPLLRITSAVAIHRQLQAAILAMDLLPGTALQDKLLSERFQVSRTPVREALIRLAEEGLVEIRPQSGTFVSRIRAEAIPEALDIRIALESMTVTRAAQAADADAIARMDLVISRQKTSADGGDTAGFHEADEAFHEAIGAIAGRPSTWRMIRSVKLQIDRARRLTLPVPGRMTQVIQEHRIIRDAVAAGDATAATAAMAHHLSVLRPDIARLRDAYPSYFA